jgi:hypothetical protein
MSELRQRFLNRTTKLVKGIYLIKKSGNETLITLIPESEFAHENTKRILDMNLETSIILQHHRRGATLYEHRQDT